MTLSSSGGKRNKWCLQMWKGIRRGDNENEKETRGIENVRRCS